MNVDDNDLDLKVSAGKMQTLLLPTDRYVGYLPSSGATANFVIMAMTYIFKVPKFEM